MSAAPLGLLAVTVKVCAAPLPAAGFTDTAAGGWFDVAAGVTMLKVALCATPTTWSFAFLKVAASKRSWLGHPALTRNTAQSRPGGRRCSEKSLKWGSTAPGLYAAS